MNWKLIVPIAVLLLVLVGATLIQPLVSTIQSNLPPTPVVTPTTLPVEFESLKGYCGSEKIPLFADPATIDVLAKFKLAVQCIPLGSTAMVADITTQDLQTQKIDFLSPSNNAASNVFKGKHNTADFPGYQVADIFYSPMVVLAVNEARDAEIKQGVVVQRDNAYWIIDMPKLTTQILNKTRWETLDSSQTTLSGPIKVGSTDPGTSNSGGLLYIGEFGNAIAGDPYQAYQTSDQPKVLPALHQIKVNVGQKASTSEDFFTTWIQGADEYKFPLAWVYESQILEWSNQAGSDIARVGKEFSILYPEPDINSVHQVICLNTRCSRLVDALRSPEFQTAAWKHAFRTVINGVANDASTFPHLQTPRLTKITNLPEADVYLATIACLKDQGACQ